MFRGFFKNKAVVAALIAAALLLALSALLAFVFEGSTPVHKAARAVLSPFQRAVTAVKSGVADFFAAHTKYDELLAENEELYAKIADMEKIVRDAGVYKEENDSLRALLDMRQRYTNMSLEQATVIAWSDTSWSSVFTLNKGENAGISAGDCVITGDGIAGRVISVSASSCEVASILDGKFGAGALISRNRLSGVSEGTLELMQKKQFRLSNLPRRADVVPGDTVETSGLGGGFPPGLLLGTVASVHTEGHGMSDYAVVDPAVSIVSLKQVFVVTDFTVSD